MSSDFPAFWWEDDGLTYVDQRSLPDDLVHARAADPFAVLDAIVTSAIAGPRSVAIFAAFGVVIARRRSQSAADADAWVDRIKTAAGARRSSLSAIERVDAAPRGSELTEALAIFEENRNVDRSIAQNASLLLPRRGSVLTHGGTGAISSGGLGTAAAAIITAHRSGDAIHAYVAESSPFLTGRRLTAPELTRAGVACTIIPDGAVAALMHSASIIAVILSAHDIAANGDTIGEIGTYAIAVAAAHHRIPFYVAVARASINDRLRCGDCSASSHLTASIDASSGNGAAIPAAGPRLEFDFTPGHLISAIITEYGITRPPYNESLPSLATRPHFAFVQPSR